jgi:hypothetical protein
MKCFFFQSKLIEAQITELFDDLWPTVTAIKNMRWQVNGYYHEMNVKQNTKLASRFVDSEEKTNRPNLYRACIEQTWEQQEYSLSKNLLTNIFALFEGWLETILPLLGVNEKKGKDLQFPDKARSTLLALQAHPNVVLVDAFYDVYITKNSCSKLAHLENYLKVYRFFKECRNSIIHRGGKADQRAIDAYNSTIGMTAADLDVKEVPEMFSVTNADEMVRISLRGVVGFSQIVLKLVEVIDAELIKMSKAIDCFVNQVKEFKPYPETLSQDTYKAEKKIEGMLRTAGFLPPRQSSAFLQLLRTKGIIRL